MSASGRAIGTHVLLEFWGAKRLGDCEFLRRALADSATEAGFHVLRTAFHQFGGGGGVSGVVLLSESHITIHTWPEFRYAALDVFLCGDRDVSLAVDLLVERLEPTTFDIRRCARGTPSMVLGQELAS